MKGRGAKPKLDFVVLSGDSNIKIALETKWCSGSNTLVSFQGKLILGLKNSTILITKQMVIFSFHQLTFSKKKILSRLNNKFMVASLAWF